MTHTEESLMALADEYANAVDTFSAVTASDKHDALRLAIREVLAERDAMHKDNFALAAGQCIVENGLLGDDHGHQYCSVIKRAEKAKAECERLRGVLREARQCVHKEANDERVIEGSGYYCDLAARIDAAMKEQP